MMTRALAVVTACLLLCGEPARADSIDTSVKELATGRPTKVRTAAVLALSKSRDPRAVLAVSATVTTDSDPTIRRIAALSLQSMITAKTADDARALAFDALDKAAKSDKDTKVRETAANVLIRIAPFRKAKTAPAGNGSSGSKPQVFVNIDKAIDQSKKATQDTADRVTKIVKKGIDRTGYSTTWPGGLPTGKELASNKSQGYIVASTVKKIEVTKAGRGTTIACTVAIRIAPWSGKDGGEKWEANRAASASGSAKAMTGNSPNEVASGMRDCLEAVAEDVTTRQVVPFLKRIAQAQ
jgi:HEAT repeats